MLTKRTKEQVQESIERIGHALFMLEMVNRIPGGDYPTAMKAADMGNKFRSGIHVGSLGELLFVYRALILMEAISEVQNEQDDVVLWSKERRLIDIIGISDFLKALTLTTSRFVLTR